MHALSLLLDIIIVHKMKLPYDILIHVGTFLEHSPKSFMHLGVVDKHMYAHVKNKLGSLPEMLKNRLTGMMQQVSSYPSYRVTYKFLYQWTVGGGPNMFALVIQNNGGKKTIGYLSRVHQGMYVQTKYISSLDELMQITTDVLLPVVSEIDFESSHQYKRKQVNLIGFL